MDPPGIDAAEALLRIARPSRQPQPQGIHRRTEVDDPEAGLFAHRRAAPIRSDGQIGMNLQHTLRDVRPHADDALAVLDQLRDLRLHLETECRTALGVFGKEVEKIPLGHECKELASRRQMREVGDRQPGLADLRVEMATFAMRPPQECVQKSEFVHHLERRRVDGVASEVAQKIGMLFEGHDFHPRPGEKEAEYHAGRPSADDTAPDVHLSAWRSTLPHRPIPSSAIMSAQQRICRSASVARMQRNVIRELLASPSGILFEHFGMTAENVVAQAKAALARRADVFHRRGRRIGMDVVG